MIDPNQLALPIDPKGGTTVTAANDAAAGDDDETVTIKRKKRKTNRRNIEDMNHLRTVVHHDEHNPFCPCGCSAPGEVIGQEVSWRLERIWVGRPRCTSASSASSAVISQRTTSQATPV